MRKPEKYKYYLRPGYNSGNLLIEFNQGVENIGFESDLLEAIKKIEPYIIEEQDIWMNDETLFLLDSNVGSFSISKDIWALAFIMSDNQSCILEINKLLLQNEKFEKIEVDFKKYWNSAKEED